MIALAIHGGAGALPRHLYSEEDINAFLKNLEIALEEGHRALRLGGSALDAVTMSVMSLENCELFNSGRGSVMAADESIQMDASIMCGRTSQCGAVTLVETIKNPILAARLVMEKTPHRLLGGPDADAFAREMGLQIEPRDYFVTPGRYEQLLEARKTGTIQLDHDGGETIGGDNSNTVGAVALDQKGNLAAGTSTGGMTNKMPGRVSDSSIIGAGTFADNSTLAFSATGTGDVFIQNVSAFDAHAMMAYGNAYLKEACQSVLKKVELKGGHGGVIALNTAGEIFMGYNSGGMFRASVDHLGQKVVEIF